MCQTESIGEMRPERWIAGRLQREFANDILTATGNRQNADQQCAGAVRAMSCTLIG